MAYTASIPPIVTRLPEKITHEADNAKFLDKKYAAILDELLCTNDPQYTEIEVQEIDRIEELRQKIYIHNNGDDYDELFETRTEDKYLMRFLRVKDYNIDAAFKQIRNYESFLSRHYSWREVHMDLVTTAFESGTVNVLQNRDSLGRRVLWFRASKWQPRLTSANQLLQMGVLLAELGVLEPTTQRSGLVIVFDMKDFGLSHLRGISAAFARRMVFVMAECLPIKISAVHIVNEPTPFSLLFAIYKKLLNDRMKEKMFFHGQNFNSLHQHVDKDILPVELRGSQYHDPKRWLALTEVPSVIKELETLNYRIVDPDGYNPQADTLSEEDG